METKLSIMQEVEKSPNKKKLLEFLGVSRSTYYTWQKRIQTEGEAGLQHKGRGSPGRNGLLESERQEVIAEGKRHPQLSCRELAVRITDSGRFFISESSVYRILKAEGLIKPAVVEKKAGKEYGDKPKTVNQQWQSDITYIRIEGWGFYFLISVLDDVSRYILAWRLSPDMTGESISDVVEDALHFARIGKDKKKPRLLTDNGSGYVGAVLNDYLDLRGIGHIFASPYHPQTNGKIERYHRTMKEQGGLLVFGSPDEFVRFMMLFVDYYNNERVHEALGNVTPADRYYGRAEAIAKAREDLKRRSIARRRARHDTAITDEHQVVPIRTIREDHPFWNFVGVLSDSEKADLLTGADTVVLKKKAS